jgi:hypothetical protein
VSHHHIQPEESARAAQWLLAEYDSTDIQELAARLEPIPWRPIFTLKSLSDPGDPMRVQASEYQDPDGWWL